MNFQSSRALFGTSSSDDATNKNKNNNNMSDEVAAAKAAAAEYKSSDADGELYLLTWCVHNLTCDYELL